MRANAPSIETGKPYRYRPVLFFAMAYLFTWIFWVPAIFVPQELGGILMLIGLLAPAVVSTVFVLASGSELLKQDLKIKIFGFYKVKWRNVLLAILQFAGIVVCSILLSLAFGQSLDQFSFTEDFSFTGVGIGSALITVTLASIIEEVGWKGYCEDSIGNYMNWFWESLVFGVIWSLHQRHPAGLHHHLGISGQRPLHSGVHGLSSDGQLPPGEDRHDARDEMRGDDRRDRRGRDDRRCQQRYVL